MVRIALQNPTDRGQAIATQEFRLRGRTGAGWSPEESSVLATTLGPRGALRSVPVFDVPETETAFQLVWTRDSREVRIPVGEIATAGKEG